MTPHTRLGYHQIAALMLVFFAIVMSALVSRRVFERLPHLEDEVAYVFQARVYARGYMVLETPQPRRAFWQPFIVDRDGRRFSKYPPGWPALLALGDQMGQPWVVNALLAGLTVALAYRLGREVFGEDTGLVGAALTSFSPMALLLNGSLMGHTAALCCSALFMYAYWRIERGRHTLRWGLVAGIALGLLMINRPLAAVGIAIPFILWSGVRLLRGLATANLTIATLRPLAALAAATLAISIAIPAYNHAATGNPTSNLYLLVWSYDTVGFGPCCGPRERPHNLEKALRHARFDLSLAAADLFGWQVGGITPELQEHLRTKGDYWPLLGLSWMLLPFGVLVGSRSKWWLALLWLVVGTVWLVGLALVDPHTLRDPTFSWLGIIGTILWACTPLVFVRDERVRWTWLLVAVIVTLVAVHLTYWVGSQRYSTRYYFEALTAAALLSALPLAWLAQRVSRLVVYGLLAAALVYSLYFYSTPRIMALYHFNRVSQEAIDAVLERRESQRPLLVIVSGSDVRWRAFGSLMAATNPFLDSDIVVAWDPGDRGLREQVLRRFPDRQVIDMQAQGEESWFLEADG